MGGIFSLEDGFPNWLRVAWGLARSLSISQEDVASLETVSCLGKQKHLAWLPLYALPTFIFTRLLFPDGGFNTPGDLWEEAYAPSTCFSFIFPLLVDL